MAKACFVNIDRESSMHHDLREQPTGLLLKSAIVLFLEIFLLVNEFRCPISDPVPLVIIDKGRVCKGFEIELVFNELCPIPC